MSTFSPSVRMKRRTTGIVAAALTSGLLAVGLGGASSAVAGGTSCKTVGVNVVTCSNVLNGNKIEVTGVDGDVNVLSNNLSHTDLTLIQVKDVLNNWKCTSVSLTIGGVSVPVTCGVVL